MRCEQSKVPLQWEEKSLIEVRKLLISGLIFCLEVSVVEGVVVLDGFLLAQDLGVQNLVIELDCSILVSAICEGVCPSKFFSFLYLRGACPSNFFWVMLLMIFMTCLSLFRLVLLYLFLVVVIILSIASRRLIVLTILLRSSCL